jgi:large subunit ribosomal protein L17
MKKKVFGKKLSRSRTAREALVRSQVRALVFAGKIQTTLPKAKILARSIDKLFTSARKQDIGSRRRVLAKLANDRKTTDRLFDLAKDWSRTSGFTRIIKLPARRGDRARVARMEFVDPLPKKQEKVLDKIAKKGAEKTVKKSARQQIKSKEKNKQRKKTAKAKKS